MNTLAHDAKYQAAWAAQRYAMAMLGQAGPLRREFVTKWVAKEKAATVAMIRRERELQP